MIIINEKGTVSQAVHLVSDVCLKHADKTSPFLVGDHVKDFINLRWVAHWNLRSNKAQNKGFSSLFEV